MVATAAPLAELRRIGKSFGGPPVLRDVSLDLRAGEVHVLAGENGAGKSTLIKVLAGVHGDYAGEVVVGGRVRRFRGPADALRAGIAVIHQELSLVPTMTVADNLALGREPRTAWGTLARREVDERARRVLARVGVDLDVRRPLGSLPLAAQQLVEIARAVAADARVLVMDEPTSALSAPEAELLFARIRDLVARGAGVFYISHKMKEIYALADRISVLRDGCHVGTAPAAEMPEGELVRRMVGRELRDLYGARRTRPGATVRRVDGLVVPGGPPEGLSFVLREREILGLAGLQGSGASSALHALFGDPPARGGWAPSPRAALAGGVALLPADRQRLGVVPELDVVANVTLAALPRLSPRGVLSPRRERAAAEAATQRLLLRAPSLAAPLRTLSGGNQQKALLARCLLIEPRVLLLDEPTRGIDVGAKADVYRLLGELADGGVAMVLITSEMEELLGLCDRILVLHQRRIAAEFDREHASQEAIVAAAMGGSR